MKENFKNNETYQNFRGERAVGPPGKWGNVTLIYPMRCRSQIFTDEVLQCVFDKYVITYQNIWGKDVIRRHLLESSYCKTLGPQRGAPILQHFLHQKYF